MSHLPMFPALSGLGWPWGISNQNQLALPFKPKSLLSHLISVSWKGPTHWHEWTQKQPPRRGGRPWATYPCLLPALHHAVMLPNHSPPGGELSGPLLLVGHFYKTEAKLQGSESRACVAPRVPTLHRGHAVSQPVVGDCSPEASGLTQGGLPFWLWGLVQPVPPACPP